MEIIRLRARPEVGTDSRLALLYTQFQTFLDALREKNLPPDVVAHINQETETLNALPDGTAGLKTAVQKAQSRLVRLVEQKLKIVPKNYYSKLWMVLGMTTFGLPMGVAFGLMLKNMGLLGIGLPIGMAVGVAVGRSMDQKAAREGRQLEVELKS